MAVVARPLRRDAAENRSRVLAAAARVFAQHGPDAGVDEVARAAGVGMGTLYRRFPTKQALIDELVAQLRSELATLGRESLALADDQCLDHLLRGTGAHMFAQRGCLQALWESSETGIESLQEFRAAMAEVLARAQRAGVARPELVPADISLTIWAVRGIIETTQAVAPDAWKRHLEISLAGLRPQAETLSAAPLTAAELRELTGSVSPVRPR